MLVAVFFILATIFLQSGIERGRADIGLSSKGRGSGPNAFLPLLGGVRTTVAAYLWLKMDRIHDKYYRDLSKEGEFIPLFRIVSWLDPRFEDAYYLGSYMLYLDKRPTEGWRFALEGLKLNPTSAKMEFNVGELSLLYRKDYPGAIRHLKRSFLLAGSDDRAKWEALSYLRTAYLKAKMPEKAGAATAALEAFNQSHPSLTSLKPENDK